MVEVIRFGRQRPVVGTSSLTELQVKAYARFLQEDRPMEKRENRGLEAILRETFPIKNYDGSVTLEYIGYEIGQPRYSPDECRLLRLTYGAPLKVRLRLNRTAPVEEDVYLGDIPRMIGGGAFIVNGAERVIVNQLHRSPGIDFMEERVADRMMHSCWVVPERGSWIELAVTKKEAISIRIDQGGKMPATIFLRACSEDYSTDPQILRTFYDTKEIQLSDKTLEKELIGSIVVETVLDPEKKDPKDPIVSTCEAIAKGHLKKLLEAGVKTLEIIVGSEDLVIVNSLKEDETKSHKAALSKIYSRLRPGTPQTEEKARQLFYDRFFDAQRYRLGRVGRFRLNRKFNMQIPDTEMTLHTDDIVNSIKYIMKLRLGEGHTDDIDHLGNRRVRTIDELAGEEIRKGFLRLKRSIFERLNMTQQENPRPKTLINSKTVSSAIDYFFGRSELSQVIDQTNPLSQLTHERRLSALGPGGLNRKRAGFEVRDVHISHYGRVCPIETPEGTNIGLISSLAIYATVDNYGFLTTPYIEVKNGRVTDRILSLRADQEIDAVMGPADLPTDKSGRILGDKVIARRNGEFHYVDPKDISYVDVAPAQIVGVSAALIPFLEHDDANRALMGSNMQRQAVPLIKPEVPYVATGMEVAVAQNSDMLVRAQEDGVVRKATADEIVIQDHVYRLRKFHGLNERTCLNQKPIVRNGERVKRGQIIADGPSTIQGELALGRNVLVAFMPWDGYNFEDAIIVSERLVKDDCFTSIHIEEFEVEIRETKLGKEEFTRDIPNVSERMLTNLGEDGIILPGTYVRQNDILVGKVAPKSKSELTPEEKLLHAIFGRAGEDVKNESLETPSGVEGIVIDTRKFSRKTNLSPSEKRKIREQGREIQRKTYKRINEIIEVALEELKDVLGRPPTRGFIYGPNGSIKNLRALRDLLDPSKMEVRGRRQEEEVHGLLKSLFDQVENEENKYEKKVNQLTRGEELPTGVLEMVKVFVAMKRNLSVGDKMAGRHGNKGVIARILPQSDMPFLADGTPVDLILNPLGVPSRMNVGQILETHLGWAAEKLGYQVICPPFDGPNEAEIEELMKKAGLPTDGKVPLQDGRTGETFDENVAVGMIYMLKLHHLVDDKIHARATGPYSLITQQPLGGKARAGGQRFGEMEVWALEAYGAAATLQELLTVKSDDVDGRTKIYESMVRGENVLEPGTPVSFEVLTNEIKGLGLSLKMEKSRDL